MKIVAFDIGATIAAATNIPGWEPTHRTYEGDRRARAAESMCAFNRLFRELKPLGLECVIYERPFARGHAATRALWGLAGILEACARNAGFEALDVTPATIKKWAAGKGNATKDDMLAAAQLLGYAGDNEHEADAYCLLCYAEANAIEEAKDEDDGGQAD